MNPSPKRLGKSLASSMQAPATLSPPLPLPDWTVGNLLNYSPGVTNGRWWLRRRVVSIAFVGSDVAAIG